MRRILSSRVFRCLVCVILVCSILVLSSPIRAKAVLAELTLAQWGLIALATLLTAGVTINIVEQFELEAIGNVYKTSMLNAAKTQQLDDDILDITFGIVFEDNTPSKIPFGSNPGGFGWALMGVLSFLDLIMHLGEETITVNPPSFGTVGEGEIVSHGKYSYEVVSATSPVHYYIWCTETSHSTIFCSPQDFSVHSSFTGATSPTTYDTTRNGVKAYYAYQYIGWEGFTAQCSPHLSKESLEEVRIHVCSLVADGAPVSELSTTIVDDTLQDAFLTTPVIDSINVPDIDLSLISSLSAITGIINSLTNGELSYEDLLKDLTGGETITVNPGGSGTNPDPGTGTNPDSGSSGSWTPPSDMGKFTLDLKDYFPFCIPFDLYDFFVCLNADPVAPVIEWVIPMPGGDTYPLEIDLSAFDSVAQLLRRLQLLLFCVGLAFKTRDLIKG